MHRALDQRIGRTGIHHVRQQMDDLVSADPQGIRRNPYPSTAGAIALAELLPVDGEVLVAVVPVVADGAEQIDQTQ